MSQAAFESFDVTEGVVQVAPTRLVPTSASGGCVSDGFVERTDASPVHGGVVVRKVVDVVSMAVTIDSNGSKVPTGTIARPNA